MNLILGNGLLGSELHKRTGWSMTDRDEFDITNPNKVRLGGYDMIINCIANTDTYLNDMEGHWDVNYKGVKWLIDYCNNKRIKLVHISTGYIYAGSVHEASETDIPVHNRSWYSYTKLLADGLVQLESNDYLLIRCIHKEYPFQHETGWIDHVGNFDYVDVIADYIIKLINAGATGVYNVGTQLKTMQQLSGKPGSFAPEYVPKDVSMNIDKLWEKLRG